MNFEEKVVTIIAFAGGLFVMLGLLNQGPDGGGGAIAGAILAGSALLGWHLRRSKGG